ncbi:hypothetical protein [Paracoccus haematequi]|uniref:hypothetical protein n=1 Tax=Paracoccus haematequi TaxID=2491866 RepID=UPI0013DEE9AD|nr:hypothetical protein [Paracoccus haematequi]
MNDVRSISKSPATGRFVVSNQKGPNMKARSSSSATPKGKPSQVSKEAAASNASRHSEALIRLADR